jgi:aminoglycoside/choline kinase family phosphotransferase
MGPPAYDVASLLMDARCDVPEDMEVHLLSRYAVGLHAAGVEFDPVNFATDYVTMGAQRATKILGIFARLDRRDGKPQYLGHLPRVWNYLMRTLEHPALSALKGWYGANVPPPAGMAASPQEPELPLSLPEAEPTSNSETLADSAPEEPKP